MKVHQKNRQNIRSKGISRIFTAPCRAGKTIKSPAEESGFTLLELMVTISIISIALISIFNLHGQTVSMNMQTGFNAVAPFLAQEILAEVDMLPENEASSDSGDFNEAFRGFSWEVFIEDASTDVIETETITLKKIDVLISFNNESIYRMRTFRFAQN